MAIKITKSLRGPPWLVLVLTLPTKRASERVEIWRKLQRFGAVGLRNSSYVLPNSPTNRERFEWLATSIRGYKGEASVLEVESIDDLSSNQLARRFLEARSRDYQALTRELAAISSGPIFRRSSGKLSRLRRRYQEIVAIDFFRSPLRRRVEELLTAVETGGSSGGAKLKKNTAVKRDFRNKLWVTRPRPEIDRVASAWLIKCFIDPKARFVFAARPSECPTAIPFDMFAGGFGHRGTDCTFETLRSEFRIRDRKARLIGEIVHDADLCDDKYGRREGFGIDEVLRGWAKQAVSDDEILKRGMKMLEGLYQAMP